MDNSFGSVEPNVPDQPAVPRSVASDGSAVVAIKDWEVYSTATSDRSLLVRSRSTGMRGYVADPTPQEWSDAFHAPSNPYPWRHPERVIADPTTAAPFSEEVKQEAIERAYGVCEN